MVGNCAVMPHILNMDDFERAFPDEEACWRHLVHLRWPNGYRCPRCQHGAASFIQRRKLFECKACHYQCSATAGTILQDTKLPLRTWFRALFLYATTKRSVSACELQRKLDLKTYRAAWLLHAKLQRVLTRAAQEPLRGLVEADEAFVGPISYRADGRGTGKAVVALAVEERGEHAGRLQALHVQDAAGASLVTFVEAYVKPGSIVKTDGWPGYEGLEEAGYQHAPEVLGDPTRAPVMLPRVHVAAGNLKRVLNGTHGGGRVSRRHLHAYLGEFVFRFNVRGWLHRAFAIAMSWLVRLRPLTFRMVVP